MKNCPACYAALPDDVDFCLNCGHRLADLETQTVIIPTEAETVVRPAAKQSAANRIHVVEPINKQEAKTEVLPKDKIPGAGDKLHPNSWKNGLFLFGGGIVVALALVGLVSIFRSPSADPIETARVNPANLQNTNYQPTPATVPSATPTLPVATIPKVKPQVPIQDETKAAPVETAPVGNQQINSNVRRMSNVNTHVTGNSEIDKAAAGQHFNYTIPAHGLIWQPIQVQNSKTIDGEFYASGDIQVFIMDSVGLTNLKNSNGNAQAYFNSGIRAAGRFHLTVNGNQIYYVVFKNYYLFGARSVSLTLKEYGQ